MDYEQQITKLMKARHKLERKIKELDLKIEHVLFRLDEEQRCMVRDCPFDNTYER